VKSIRKTRAEGLRGNLAAARARWGTLCATKRHSLKTLVEVHDLSVVAGDLHILDGRWYVTHAGLLRLAQRRRCCGIRTSLQKDLSDPASGRWVFRAIVYKSPRSRGFVGYGDADPSNTSSLVRGAELRVAETRAVNRALRKAYGIGLCSVEELGWSPRSVEPDQEKSSPPAGNNGHRPPRLRDQLCLLIRQHRLDASLVKQYAAEFCGTQALREASREMVEDFIRHLAEWAARDREGLLCHLNRYASQPEEVKP